MNYSRLLRCGLPLLALVLLWSLPRHNDAHQSDHRVADESRPPHSAYSGEGQLKPEGFKAWLDDFKNSSDRGDLQQGIRIAQQRRQALKQLIQTNPQLALQFAISPQQRAQLPEEITALLETPISAAGEFEMIVSCYTGEARRPTDAPELERFVTIGAQRFRAFTFGRRAEMQTKDRISLHGIAIDDVLALHPDPVRRLPEQNNIVVEVFGAQQNFVSEDELDHYITSLLAYENSPGAAENLIASDDDPPVANSTWTEGNKRILYLRVRFADQDPSYEPVSLASATSRQADVAEHFRLASYGKMLVTTVFPDVINLSMNKSEYVGNGLGTMMNEARALAITMGQAEGEDWDYNNYDFYTIVSSGGIGGYAGIAQVGGRKSHLQDTSLRTAGHEFGHNFGLGHAHYNYTSDLNPRGATPTNGLARVEYGHRFSIMSGQSGSDLNNPALPHFTAHEKWRLDWLTDADFTDITSGSQSGTFRLYQNDDIDATGIRALRLPSGGALSKYWLSYRSAWRQPIRSSNNDYLLNGIVFDWTGSGGGSSTLLDMTPFSDEGSQGGASWTRDNSDKWDAPLLIGRTYTDDESLVSVTPIARGGAAPDEYIDVYVHLATGMESTLVGESDACRAIIPNAATATGTGWTAISFDDTTWPFSGPSGVGYDESPDYEPYFGVDVESAMNNQHESCYIRIPFTIDSAVDLADIVSLKLRMRYDDGFVAYINGIRIAEANAPGTPDWESGATSNHSDISAVSYDDFSADAALGALVNGNNVLAIHGLNNGQSSSDFLIQATLAAVFTAGQNSPPSVSLAADTIVASVGQDITFTATGSDPDSDPLAYAWDFDIGDGFAPEGLNNAVAIRSWSSAGFYSVTITCSDRKGGVTRDRVMVKIGNPSNAGIVRGRALRGGQPVAGARIALEGSDKQSITLDDGSYAMAGLSTASSTTLSAMFDGEVFQSALAMPVTPNPLLEGVDFFAHSSEIPEAPVQQISLSPHLAATDTSTTIQLTANLWDNSLAEDLLMPFGDTWKYLDTGVDPGASWIDQGFDDSAWLDGAAELGYGDSQATEISYGTDTANRHITSWFRRSFTATDVPAVSRLKLSLKRDDGVRVFLNGTEIARDNLTTGTVSSTTKASNDVSSSNEETLLHYTVDPGLLIDGQNIIAAEIHQEDDDSNDLSFDLQLSGARNLSNLTPTWSVSPTGASVSAAGVFSATQPGSYTITATSGSLTDSAIISVATDNVVSIAALDEFLWENGSATSTVRISRTGSTDSALTVPISIGGEATSGVDFQPLPSSITILAGELFAELTLSVSDDTDEEGREFVYITPQAGTAFTLGASAVARVTIIDDENRYVPAPDAGSGSTVYVHDPLILAGSLLGADRFIAQGDYWKYDDTGTDLGVTWSDSSFADTAWLEGLAKFGYGDNDEITTVRFGGSSSSKQITTYFRRRFYISDPSDYSGLTADLLVDDGAVIYINGSEVLRDNLPSSTISYSTRAQSSVGGDDEETFFPWSLDPTALVAGENVVCVEIHQSSPSSSDLGFDMNLRGMVAAPPAGTSLLWKKQSGPGNVTFSDDESLNSTVDFDEAGTYVLRLEISRLGVIYSDDITINVDPVPDFSQWIGDSSVTEKGALEDPDGDGWNNLMEFSSATDPSSGSSHAKPDLARDLASPEELLFTYRRLRALLPAHASGITGDGYSLYGISYTIEATDDPETWQAASSVLTLQQEGTPIDNGDGSETVTARLIPPANNGQRWFARLRIMSSGGF
ncbi:MAG: hypothetical protein ACI9NC_001365 [Verrucomicrobiales bacterium]|jgi:hypothetical protein